MKKRYIKVLGLYSFSTFIPAIIATEKLVPNHTLKWVLRTLAGYGIFAYGLHILSKFK
ncbi:hypothetical protein [Staphylococcus pseudoxylosus]|uniref:hypothetical protein n=2 Tax=Staphylococcus TaxID=1279 RepID=UPI002DBF9949|nr:hypothetical protein [Staphylococcus pseudoxylosus]MEB6043900.1 hypothetical protein [Staphylococcus pseudoxylosus]MEB8009679.1 hypothetical protein [Staphylococcus pseudoxylosus]